MRYLQRKARSRTQSIRAPHTGAVARIAHVQAQSAGTGRHLGRQLCNSDHFFRRPRDGNLQLRPAAHNLSMRGMRQDLSSFSGLNL